MKLNKTLLGLFVASNLLAFNLYWIFYLDIRWHMKSMGWIAGLAVVNFLVYFLADFMSDSEKPDEYYYYNSKKHVGEKYK